MADYEAVEALLDAALADFGRVDFVINNAGAARGADRVPVIDLDPDLWYLVLDVNLNGVFYMSQVFGCQLIEQGSGGAIINLILPSIAGKMLGPNTAAYASSKAGLQALTAGMEQEVGKHGVRVTRSVPASSTLHVWTTMGHGDFWQRTIDARIPMGRAGTGADIASITAFLCATEGEWITGQSYNVDGGTCVQH